MTVPNADPVDEPADPDDADPAADDVTEPPSETDDTADPADPDDGDGTDEPQDGDEDEEKPAPPKGSTARADLEKKFAHIKDPQQREEAIAQAWWDKNNYAAKTQRENKLLKQQIDALKAAKAKAPEKAKEPPPPDPDIQELDQRISGLVDRDKAAHAEAESQLVKLGEIDKEIHQAEARLEDAKKAEDDTKVARLEGKLETLQARREGTVQRYKDLLDRRGSIAYDYERAVRDKAWLERVKGDQATRQETEAQEAEDFRIEFPQMVDNLIEAAGERAGIPPQLLEDLLIEVNDGLAMDLMRATDAKLDDVDVPELVAKRVERFANARDIASRQKFRDLSKKKLEVTGTRRTPAAPDGTQKRAVSPAQMSGSGLGPKMKAARDYLASKGF